MDSGLGEAIIKSIKNNGEWSFADKNDGITVLIRISEVVYVKKIKYKAWWTEIMLWLGFSVSIDKQIEW